jgi:hypothetical protein
MSYLIECIVEANKTGRIDVEVEETFKLSSIQVTEGADLYIARVSVAGIVILDKEYKLSTAATLLRTFRPRITKGVLSLYVKNPNPIPQRLKVTIT